jgi:serine phosphatase RsbU (regulator of sigma subunit)
MTNPFLRTHPAGLDYYGDIRPAGTGRHFFDFLSPDGNTLVCSLARIHGEGRAAFAMASLRAFLRSLAGRYAAGFGAVVRELNRTVYEIAPDSFYASLFYAWIDAGRAQVHYVSAGHGPVLLVRPGQARVRRLESGGAAPGLTLLSEFRQRTVDLAAGDVLLATAGAASAASCDQEIVEVARRRPDLRLVDLVSGLLSVRKGAAVAVRLQERAGAARSAREEAELVCAAG